MSYKIKINILGFGERFCSNNVEFYNYKYCYEFYKKGTVFFHNEYGMAYEHENGSYAYFINNKYHRLSDYAYYDFKFDYKSYYIFDKYLGNTKEEFIKNLANTLIPLDNKNL